MRHESVLDQASPLTWFSRKGRPFIRPLRKREMLCVLIRERREESYGGKKTGKSTKIFICIILEGAQIGFIPVTVNCVTERTTTISQQKPRLRLKGQNAFFVLLCGLQGRMHVIFIPRRIKYILQDTLLISVFETSLVFIWLISMYVIYFPSYLTWMTFLQQSASSLPTCVPLLRLRTGCS